MLKLAADEDFNNRIIIRGSLRRGPELDLVRIQDAGLHSRDDASILECAANEGRVLLTHDVTTIRTHAYAAFRRGFRCLVFLRSVKNFRSALPSRRY